MEDIYKDSIVFGGLMFIKNSCDKHILYVVVYVASLVYYNFSTYLTKHSVDKRHCINFMLWPKYYIQLIQWTHHSFLTCTLNS